MKKNVKKEQKIWEVFLRTPKKNENPLIGHQLPHI